MTHHLAYILQNVVKLCRLVEADFGFGFWCDKTEYL